MKLKNKFKAAVTATQKAKEIGSGLQAHLRDSQTSAEFVSKVLASAKAGLQQAGIKSREMLHDETKFLKAIDFAHSHLPLPYRIIMPKKLFTKLLRGLRDRISFKNGTLEFEKGASESVVSTLKEEEKD